MSATIRRKSIWKNENGNAPATEFLGWVLFLSILVQGILLLLEPYSIAYVNTGHLTIGYAVYAVLGMFASTPCPLIALFFTLRRREHISIKAFCKRLVHTPKPAVAIAITAIFCTLAFVFALCRGTSNDAPWYTMPLGFLIMIPFVGIAEESGWRGFLQPELEKRFPFPIAVSFTAAIWYIWHLPIWLQPTSNHYGDSLIGFAIMIFVWSFAAASIYKATKSVLACGVYHAFVNSIGAIYDWNALFDAYPKTEADCLYFGVVLALALIVWTVADKRDRERTVNLPCQTEAKNKNEGKSA